MKALLFTLFVGLLMVGCGEGSGLARDSFGKVLDGLWTEWYENGQKQEESTYKDGKIISAVVWKPNGEKCPVTNIKDGNGVLVWYKEDGTEVHFPHKDGVLVVDYPPRHPPQALTLAQGGAWIGG